MKSDCMYFIYIMQSETTGRYYIGMTENINLRIKHNNSGANRSTKNKGPWNLIYQEKYQDKKSAWIREQQIKSYKGGEAFKKLIHGEVA
ncbi:MAG: Excinuclease abc c subunit domain protein [Parcubacteria group bacterium GW2011_GWF2_45_11]|nr:MAG: Excinuclease abc c subunit domain protein [Parcubacteria group bacterium GW2011_GWF2_45_11]KKT97299.1 MAG: Excinuclease abc c subunit domain protein [Parcubacteria group bacterium GW2011_GWC2_45_15]